MSLLFTGAALRPKFPNSEGFARAMLLLHKPWREAGDLREEPEDTWAPEFNRFLESESCHLALKVSAERARAATRARNAPCGYPSQADFVDPVDINEEHPRIYARQDGGTADLGPHLGDFRDYGDARDWTSVSLGGGHPGSEESATWPPRRVAQFRSTGICDDLADGGSAQATRYDPYDANGEHRSRIALVLKTIRDWVGGCAEYRPLRIPTSGDACTGRSFVIHVIAELARKLPGFPGAAAVYAPTGIAAFQAGGIDGSKTPPTPNREEGCLTARAVAGRIRKAKGNLSRCALLIGDERGAVGCSMLWWQEYNAGISPI